MIRLIKEDPNIDYSWLLDKPNIRVDYAKLYLENYIYNHFNIISYNKWQKYHNDELVFYYNINDTELRRVYRELKNSTVYKFLDSNTGIDTYFNSSSDIPHELSVDMNNKCIKVSVRKSNIEVIISDQYLINLYNDENDILMKLLSSKKGE